MTETEIVLADLDAFRARCEEAEYTDTGEAWVMIDRLEDALRATLKQEKPSLEERVAQAKNRSDTDPTWRTDYR